MEKSLFAQRSSNKERRPYHKPQVVYRDVLKTRAGSPLGVTPKDGLSNPFDPANLFGTD